MQFTDDFKNKFVAPGMSAFTEASIPDMSAVSKEQDCWLLNFMLNTGLRVTLDDAIRRTLYNFLRRTEAAFRAYADARRLTLAWLVRQKPNAVSDYILAIGHWEQFLSQADQAWFVLNRGEKGLFTRRDGSVVQRLDYLYNLTKHLESAIKSDQLPPGGTLAMWLANDGLHSTTDHLTFAEAAEILKDLALWADAAQDPLTMRANIRATYGLQDEDPDTA